jgi:hypothetical protein
MKVILLSLVVVAACGDNVDPPDVSNDAAPDEDGGVTHDPRAVVVAGDFVATGLMSAFDLEARTSMNNVAPATAIGVDPVVRRFGNELFVVNRIENNVTILDANDFSLVEQLGTGAGSNPQDVAIHNDKLWIPVYGGTGIVQMTRGSSTITPIDLSADDPDGKPNCASIYKVANKLFVTCQLLDNTDMNLPPRGTGKVYVIDVATNVASAELDLATANPFSLLELLPSGDLVVGTVDFRFGNNNAGCIERITTGATPGADGCFLDNTMLSGGFASRIAVTATQLLVLVPRADFSGGDVRVVDVNGSTAALQAEPYNTAGQALNDVDVCPDGEVVVAENPPFGAPSNAPQGLRLYSGPKTEATTAAVNVGLKPASSHGLVCY